MDFYRFVENLHPGSLEPALLALLEHGPNPYSHLSDRLGGPSSGLGPFFLRTDSKKKKKNKGGRRGEGKKSSLGTFVPCAV